MTQPVFRFAPSPNGRLHLGHAYSAILNHDMARRCGGRFLVRIEDIDTMRCRPELCDAVLEDLHWLGLSWEEPVWKQSERFATYETLLDRLKAAGLVYPAFLSRTEIAAAVSQSRHNGNPWPLDPDGAPHYPGAERERDPEQARADIASGKPHGWRLDMRKALAAVSGPLTWMETSSGGIVRIEADPQAWGDVLLARKDVPASYHLCVVADDAAQGVTHVVRGRDLYAATAIHRLLQMLFDLPEPVYHHHGLLTDAAGAKLSKSAGSQAIARLREAGMTAMDVRQAVGLALRQTG